ncbi:uncharacterized protein LOC122498224 [Leptopilina heterotoma]|uniref:uncharacterized protein LOC122498224 n=1 Tax=Leptopilina heterotoma TaxID=63436 RepID=UPI001CA94290|nr:uncharacterized protein LOC122498224 [Leptopilina heterotoma]
MHSLFIISICVNCYLVSLSEYADAIRNEEFNGDTNPIFVGNIDVYDVEQSTVRLVIPINKKEYVKTNYLVSFDNKSTHVIQDIKDIIYLQVFDSLVMFISGLSPSTTFQFCVVDKSRGIFFKSQKVTTKKASQKPEIPDESMFYVTFVENEFIFTTKYHLHWQNTEVWYRVVLVEVNKKNEINIGKTDLDETINSIHFRKILSGHSYKFKVRACNEYGCSNQMVSKNYVAGSFTQGIKVLSVTKTTCTISWKSKWPNNYNYFIQIIDKGDRNIKKPRINKLYFVDSIIIDRLHPGNIYSISVSKENLQESPYEEIECLTPPVERKPDNANITSFTISFDYGIAKIELNDNSIFENCAQYYRVCISKNEIYDSGIECDVITCKKHEIGPYYFDVGSYYVTIKACNAIGCSKEVRSRDHEIVKRKEPEPLSYKVLDTKEKSCTIQWIKQQPNISIIREETILISDSFPYGDYKIYFIVIGFDDNVLNIHTAKDACIAQHSKFLPAVPKENEFDILLAKDVATVKMHNDTNINCEIEYKIRLWLAIPPYRERQQVSLLCYDEHVNIKLFFISDFNFKIRACNDKGCSSAMTSSLYTTYKQTSELIGPKGPLQVLHVTDKTCKIQWTKPTNNTENVQYHIKYYIEGNSLPETVKNFVTSSSEPSTMMDELEPRSKYNVIVGIVKNEKMSFEVVHGKCYTQNLRDWNDAQKRNISVYAIKKSRVQFMIPLNRNEYKQSEIIVYVKEGNKTFTSTATNDFNFNELAKYVFLDVHRLQPGTTYRFRIVEKSRGLYFESKHVRTLDKTLELSESIKIYKVELYSIWLTIPVKNNEYVETNFGVNIKKEDNSKIMRAHRVVYVQAENTLVMIVFELSPNTTYEFEVVQNNKNVVYKSTKVTTFSGVPDKPKENRFYISFEKNEAILTRKEHYHWQDTRIWYRIQLLEVDGNTENLIEATVLDANANSNHFTNLTQGHKYKFRIEACNRTGISESIVTREYTAGNYERPIEVLNFTDTTCTILWKKPENAAKDMINFIHVTDKGGRDIIINYPFASPGIPFKIYNLYPGNEYAFAVSTIEAMRSPFVETDCRTTPVKVNPRKPEANSFNISFYYGVVQIQFINYSIYQDCEKVYNVFIHKKEGDISVVYDRITCRNYKVGPYYFEPGTYFIMIQSCHTSSECSEFIRSREYTIVKMKEPTPLFYRVLETTEDSCTIQWMKTRNMSDIHYETIWFSKNSINDGYKINFIVIGTDNQPFNIHTAKDACIAHHLIVIPGKPKESDFDIMLHSVDTSFLKRQNIATIKLHNNTDNNCELWYTIKMCIFSSTCFDEKILSCNKHLDIADISKPEFFHFIIAACNEIGCSQPMNTKLYIGYNPSDELHGPEGPIQILNYTNTSCTIEWELPKYSTSYQKYDNVNRGTSHFVMYYIHFYIEHASSSEHFKIYQFPVSTNKPSYTLKELSPGSNYNIIVGVLKDYNKSTKSILTECHTLFS